MKTVECPICHGAGICGVIGKDGYIVRDADGLGFYEDCWKCRSEGEIEVEDDWEEVVDDREGEDDYRKGDELEHEDRDLELRASI